MPPQTPENLDELSKTEPIKVIRSTDTPPTTQKDLDEMAITQPIKRVARPENPIIMGPENKSTTEQLAEDSLRFLDRLAIKLTTVNGKQINYLNQTFLDFLGIPTVLSAGDVVGFLKGYLNVRQGNIVRGAAEIITAIVTGIPTGPAHKLIDIIDNFLEQKSE